MLRTKQKINEMDGSCENDWREEVDLQEFRHSVVFLIPGIQQFGIVCRFKSATTITNCVNPIFLKIFYADSAIFFINIMHI